MAPLPFVGFSMSRQPSSLRRASPDVLRQIPLTSRRVLELGCGSGDLGACYRWRNPAVHWGGIERDATSASLARQSLDAVLHGDIERLDDDALAAFAGDAPLDTLVFGDVLEHLRDPLVQLKRLVALLRPGGTVVACIPNIGHWTVVEALLRGDWTYGDDALPDSTHLRFFTPATATALLAAAGLVVLRTKQRHVPVDADRQARFLDALGPILPALGVDRPAAEARLKSLQTVLIAQKAPTAQPLELHQTVMVRRLLEARVEAPWEALAAQPGIVATQSDRIIQRSMPAPGAPKVMVWQRRLVGELKAWTSIMRQLIADGWIVVSEWDDHPDLLPGSAQESWRRHPWVPMSGVHACQVSTRRLAEAFREHNPEVAVFENALLDCPPLPEKDEGRVRVVYAAVNRPGVARLISPALDRASDDPRVEIVVVGDDKVFASTRAVRKTYRPVLPYAEYLALLDTCDISLLPLRGGPAELCKSPLKFLESARSGAVCIGSPGIYEETIEHGRTGWIARGQDDFTQLLVQAVEDAPGRARMAAAAWEAIRAGHLQSHQVARREAWYRGLASRLGELNESLFQRHPELRP
jgi:trans-aconitate methyltransferase